MLIKLLLNPITIIQAIKYVSFSTKKIYNLTNKSFQARLWVQMMRELRQGCRLKKVDYTNLPPVEYELTPFEILLEDIRTRRYTLNKIMVSLTIFILYYRPCTCRV